MCELSNCGTMMFRGPSLHYISSQFANAVIRAIAACDAALRTASSICCPICSRAPVHLIFFPAFSINAKPHAFALGMIVRQWPEDFVTQSQIFPASHG
jgi:hypothetical protein